MSNNVHLNLPKLLVLGCHLSKSHVYKFFDRFHIFGVVVPYTTNILVSIIFPGGSIFSKVSSVGDVGSPRFSEGVHYRKMDLTPYTDLVHGNGPKPIL